MPLEIVETFPVGLLGCNCVIVADPATGEALVVDPGDEVDRILSSLDRSRLHAVALVHTHAHFDHVGGSARLAAETGAPLLLHADDVPLYAGLEAQGRLFGFRLERPGQVTRTLADGERLACGSGSLEVLHTPGHTAGSVCFRLDGPRPVLLSGDTLFRRSIGRTDLPGGSFEALVTSIESRLFTLPGDAWVLPGHGEPTTIAEESRLNPFVGDASRRLS